MHPFPKAGRSRSVGLHCVWAQHEAEQRHQIALLLDLDAGFGHWPAGPNGLATALFAYAVVAMQRVYGNIHACPADVFRSPFDATVEGFMPGRLDIFNVLRQ